MDNNRLSQLDGLRGIFALIVTVYHFPYENEYSGFFVTSNFLIRQGDLFVDFFFVLSGFVISINYSDKLNSISTFKQFIKKRFNRLYPLLFFTVIVYLLFELISNIYLAHLLKNKETLWELGRQTLNSLLMLNSTSILGGGVGMNYPSWSISAEMISYIIFGIIAISFTSIRKYVLALSLLACVVYFVWTNKYVETEELGFVRGIICFLTGYFTFRAFKSFRAPNNIIEYLIPLLLLIMLYTRYTLAEKEMFTLFIIPPFYGFAIFVYSKSDGVISRALSNKLFTFLGEISYSVYLNHAIVLMIVPRVIFIIFDVPITSSTVTLCILLCLFIIVVYSYVTYWFIEKRKFLRLSISQRT